MPLITNGITAKQAAKLARKQKANRRPLNIKDAMRYIKGHAKLGYSNTSFYIKPEHLDMLVKALQEGEFKVHFSNTEVRKDSVLVEVEW